MSRDRRTLGIILIVAGFAGLIVSLALSALWIYPFWFMGPMMGGWSRGELEEASGKVETVKWSEIELKEDGKEFDMHGPLWFWQGIEIKEGDAVTAKGVFVAMMGHGEGWHQDFVPFELTVNGRTYGNATEGVPVWMQAS